MSDKISVCFLTRAVLDENIELINCFLASNDLEIDNNAGIGKTPYYVAMFKVKNSKISGLLKDHGASIKEALAGMEDVSELFMVRKK